MDGIVTALMEEAVPFISGLALKPVKETPFRIFKGKGAALVVSGIGKVNGALACEYIILEYGVRRILSFGSAGALSPDIKLWDIFGISAAFERDVSGGIRLIGADTVPGHREAVLATGDKPAVSSEERRSLAPYADLVDMEGAAVIKACKKLRMPVYLFKAVSDTVETDSSEIKGNILRAGELLWEYAKAHELLSLPHGYK